jgi:quercetin dioxygenase-like cupin family protein
MKKSLVIVTVAITLMSCKVSQTNLKSDTMNLKNLHTENKAVQTHLLFQPTEAKVVSLQIKKNEQLAEHVSKVPALLVCVSGKATYTDETGLKILLTNGDYVAIKQDVKHWIDAQEESNFLLIK